MDELIYRQAAIEALSCSEIPNSSDYISRQTAIDALDKYCEVDCPIRDDKWCPDCQYEEFRNIIANLPSADARVVHRGKWRQDISDPDSNVWWCDFCDEPYQLMEGTPKDNAYNFCPNCGADMKGGNHGKTC
jgi:hypothetical protein